MGDNDSYARTDALVEMPPGVTDSNEYDTVPCPNKFIVTDNLADRYTNDLKNDVFHSLPSDSEGESKFLKVMEAGIHKNNIGNWEMPLPFRQEEVRLPNDRNPADLETRGLHPSKMMESVWLNGPTFLRNTAEVPPSNEVMSTNDSDPEVRKEAISCKTKIGNSQSSGLGAERFKRFSSLSSLRRALANLIVKLREFKLRKERPATKPTIPGCNNRCLSAIVGLKIPELLCTSEEFSLSIEDIATKSGCTSSKQLYPMMRVLAQWGIGKELENKRFAKTQAMELLRRDKGPSLGHMLEYFGSDEFIMATRQMATSIRHGEPAFVLEHGMTHLQYMYEFDQSPDDKGKTSEGSSEHPSYDRRRELANNYESAMAYMTDLLILPEDPGVHNVYKAFPWSTCSRLVDMGGSTGYFLASILKQPDCEHIQGYVVELPEAVNDAQKKIQNLGIPQHRMEFIKHDFTKPFPSELQLQVDTVMFKNVIEKNAT
ncbi:hypothetical protein QZH41_007905 [Actinostola sp. cb2023]|nr:hypothetical protein QZH41_007905 [Actinostola sp. cb2023]